MKYEKSEEKVSEFREKLKETRLELSSRDRQLEVAKRMIQRINVEKGDIEVGLVKPLKLEMNLSLQWVSYLIPVFISYTCIPEDCIRAREKRGSEVGSQAPPGQRCNRPPGQICSTQVKGNTYMQI